MGLCGCYPACACQVESGNALVSVSGTGDPVDPFLVSGNETPFAVDLLNDGIEYAPAGPYGHAPQLGLRFEDSATIALAVVPGVGLQAHLLSAPGAGGGVPTGTPLPWLTNVAPAGYLMLSGPNKAGYIPIVDEPALFAVIDHGLSGGVDPGDGTFFVGLPDDHFLITQGTLGPLFTTGGSDEIALAETNLPPHDHPITDLGHDHGGTTTDGSHAHTPSTAGRSFVTAATPVQKLVAEDGSGNLTIVVTNDGTANDDKQLNNGATASDGAHAHDVPAQVTGITETDDAGGGVPLPHLPPYIVTNYMIKT